MNQADNAKVMVQIDNMLIAPLCKNGIPPKQGACLEFSGCYAACGIGTKHQKKYRRVTEAAVVCEKFVQSSCTEQMLIHAHVLCTIALLIRSVPAAYNTQPHNGMPMPPCNCLLIPLVPTSASDYGKRQEAAK